MPPWSSFNDVALPPVGIVVEGNAFRVGGAPPPGENEDIKFGVDVDARKPRIPSMMARHGTLSLNNP